MGSSRDQRAGSRHSPVDRGSTQSYHPQLDGVFAYRILDAAFQPDEFVIRAVAPMSERLAVMLPGGG
jgi:hypothetical protein